MVNYVDHYRFYMYTRSHGKWQLFTTNITTLQIHRKGWKERCLTRERKEQNNRTRIFEGILFLEAISNTKTNKSLICCQLGSCRRKWVETESRAQFFLREPNWQHISDLFVFVLFVALKTTIPSEIRILSCFVWLNNVLFNLFCVFYPFFQNAGSQSCFRFIF